MKSKTINKILTILKFYLKNTLYYKSNKSKKKSIKNLVL